MPQRVRPADPPDGGESIKSRLATLAVLLIFLSLGGGLSFWGWRIVQDARASTSWPQARGTVTRSEVTRSTNSDGADSYSPEVTYTYLVGNQYQESHIIKFGENSYDSRRRAEKIAAQYPLGKDVTVYYDPARPGKSVLEPGITGGSYIVLGIGALFVLIGLVVAPVAHFFRHRSAGAT